jgi:ubiquinone/menaquinone biosynthesis C-methylase UbiE
MHDELEKHEQEKYNCLVTNCDYGRDYTRESQISRISQYLEKVSETYIKILSELKEKDTFKVLDGGCGPGGVMEWLRKEYGANVYGIDISEEFIKMVQLNFPLLKNLHVGNAKNMKMFGDNSFDLVQHLDGMEHIPTEWEHDCLKEAVRVSKKYVFYENACQDSEADKWAKESGFTASHINIKNGNEWLKFYTDNSSKYNYEILVSATVNTCYNDHHFTIILQKNET